MNVPVEVVISWGLVVACLLFLLAAKSRRVGYLEGQLKVELGRYEALYQRYNSDHAAWHRSPKPTRRTPPGGTVVSADMLARCDSCGVDGCLMGPCVIIAHADDCAWVATNRALWPKNGRCLRGHEWCTCSGPVGAWRTAGS